MTHMMLNEDVQSQVEAYRADMMRLKGRDKPEYMRILTDLRSGPILRDQDVDALTILVAHVTLLIDEIDAGEIE